MFRRRLVLFNGNTFISKGPMKRLRFVVSEGRRSGWSDNEKKAKGHVNLSSSFDRIPTSQKEGPRSAAHKNLLKRFKETRQTQGENKSQGKGKMDSFPSDTIPTISSLYTISSDGSNHKERRRRRRSLERVIDHHNSLYGTSLAVEYDSYLEDNKWVSLCTVNGEIFRSRPHDRKFDAEHNATSAALESLQARTPILHSTPLKDLNEDPNKMLESSSEKTIVENTRNDFPEEEGSPLSADDADHSSSSVVSQPKLPNRWYNVQGTLRNDRDTTQDTYASDTVSEPLVSSLSAIGNDNTSFVESSNHHLVMRSAVIPHIPVAPSSGISVQDLADKIEWDDWYAAGLGTLDDFLKDVRSGAAQEGILVHENRVTLCAAAKERFQEQRRKEELLLMQQQKANMLRAGGGSGSGRSSVVVATYKMEEGDTGSMNHPPRSLDEVPSSTSCDQGKSVAEEFAAMTKSSKEVISGGERPSLETRSLNRPPRSFWGLTGSSTGHISGGESTSLETRSLNRPPRSLEEGPSSTSFGHGEAEAEKQKKNMLRAWGGSASGGSSVVVATYKMEEGDTRSMNHPPRSLDEVPSSTSNEQGKAEAEAEALGVLLHTPMEHISGENTSSIISSSFSRNHNVTFSTQGQTVILTIPTRGVTLRGTGARGNTRSILANTPRDGHMIAEFDNLIVNLWVVLINDSGPEPSVLPTAGSVDIGKNLKIRVSGDHIITLEIDSSAPMKLSSTGKMNTVARSKGKMIIMIQQGSRRVQYSMIPNSNLALFLDAFRLAPGASRKCSIAPGLDPSTASTVGLTPPEVKAVSPMAIETRSLNNPPRSLDGEPSSSSFDHRKSEAEAPGALLHAPMAHISGENASSMRLRGLTRSVASEALSAQGPNKTQNCNVTFSTQGQTVIMTIPTRGVTLQKNSKGNVVLASTHVHMIAEFDNLIVNLSVSLINGSGTEPSVLPTAGSVDIGKNLKIGVSGDHIITLEIDSSASMKLSSTGEVRTVARSKGNSIMIQQGSRRVQHAMIPNSNLALFLHAFRLAPGASRKCSIMPGLDPSTAPTVGPTPPEVKAVSPMAIETRSLNNPPRSLDGEPSSSSFDHRKSEAEAPGVLLHTPMAHISGENASSMRLRGLTRSVASEALSAQGPNKTQNCNVTFSTQGQTVILTIPTRGVTLQKNYMGNVVLASTDGHMIAEFDNLIVNLSVSLSNGSGPEPSILPTAGSVDIGKNLKIRVSGDHIITLEIDSSASMKPSSTGEVRTVARIRQYSTIPNSNLTLFLHAFRISPTRVNLNCGDALVHLVAPWRTNGQEWIRLKTSVENDADKRQEEIIQNCKKAFVREENDAPGDDSKKERPYRSEEHRQRRVRENKEAFVSFRHTPTEPISGENTSLKLFERPREDSNPPGTVDANIRPGPFLISKQTFDLRIIPPSTPSICIPKVLRQFGEERIRRIFDDLNMGEIERVEVIPKRSRGLYTRREKEYKGRGEEYNFVVVHFKRWASDSNAEQARQTLLQGDEVKVVYDDPLTWKISAYRMPKEQNENKGEGRHRKPEHGQRSGNAQCNSKDEGEVANPQPAGAHHGKHPHVLPQGYSTRWGIPMSHATVDSALFGM